MNVYKEMNQVCQGLTFAILIKWVKTAALVFVLLAFRISLTTQKLTCIQ